MMSSSTPAAVLPSNGHGLPAALRRPSLQVPSLGTENNHIENLGRANLREPENISPTATSKTTHPQASGCFARYEKYLAMGDIQNPAANATAPFVKQEKTYGARNMGYKSPSNTS